GAAPLGRRARALRAAGGRAHAARLRERPRARDRRGAPPGHRRNARRRRHDLRRSSRRPHGRSARRGAHPPPRRRHVMKAVLAYSGGLDTSCAIAWLKEDYGFDEVVAVLVDVGQEADFEPAIKRGYAAGADDVILLDKKDEFAETVVAKALLANALYEG